MKILMTTSETVPFAKTGGLADAVSALSLALARLGHAVRIVMPRYFCIDRTKLEQLEGPLGVRVGGGEEWCAVYTAELAGSTKKNPVRVYFIDYERFFGRDGIYGTPAEPDFLDNALRYTFFSRAVFQLCRKINWYPHVIHSHDWPTALVPVFLKYGERNGPFADTVSVLTIHNLGYQGIYSKNNYYYTNLDWDLFYQAGFDDWNMMNLLKAGICSADKLTTVSPHYAEETKTPAYGFRLDGVLRQRAGDYQGIANGIDTEVWDPQHDPYIPLPYTIKNVQIGKAAAKEAIQKQFGLSVNPDIPLIGMVNRLTDQKGIGELFGPTYGCVWSLCQNIAMQMVVLGSGESWCEHEIRNLSARLANFKAQIGYDEKISHLIEAGSDFFLMPSRYEPSGLNQMYSLRYGTIPIVRNTGGLADTVENFNQDTGAGTGFMFDDLTPQAIYNTVGWAVWAYYNRRSSLAAMQKAGMKHDFSWKKSAQQYEVLYKATLART
ncbi:MAG: glycogen synthase [Spirochaetaceae bacterium]|jgi:starch synthase|nr:glycogen synthase [Spirochaetaceae bacterium]